MKTTRKILPALVMLLVSAIMLSTASYAWFASNSEVAVNNMHVKVKANTKFLEISETNAENSFASAVTFATPTPFAEGEGYELVHAAFEGTDPATLGWYVGNSDNRGDAHGTKNELDKLTFSGEVTLDRYALQKTVYVRMSPSSDTTLENLRIDTTATKIANLAGTTINDKLANALRILAVATQLGATESENVVCGAQIYDPYATGEEPAITTYNNGAADSYLVEEVELGETYQVDIYIYYDGEDKVAFTDNIITLEELIVNVGFVAGPEVENP